MDAGLALLDELITNTRSDRTQDVRSHRIQWSSASRRARFQARPTPYRRIPLPQAGICAKPAAMQRIAVGVSTPVSHGTRRLCAPPAECVPQMSRDKAATVTGHI